MCPVENGNFFSVSGSYPTTGTSKANIRVEGGTTYDYKYLNRLEPNSLILLPIIRYR